jgi:hypothetical protein
MADNRIIRPNFSVQLLEERIIAKALGADLSTALELDWDSFILSEENRRHE